MSYIEKNLLPQEQLIYRAQLHWIIFVPGLMVLVAALVLVAYGSQVGGERNAYGVFGVLLFIIGICVLLSRWVEYKTSEFGVTNKRVLIKVGLIRRNSLELLLRQIEGISVEQNILGRVFGYGSLVVNGTGGTKEPFAHISSPLEFRRQVQGQSVDTPVAPPAVVSAGEEKTCPNCAERVKLAARSCRFCGHKFE